MKTIDTLGKNLNEWTEIFEVLHCTVIDAATVDATIRPTMIWYA